MELPAPDAAAAAAAALLLVVEEEEGEGKWRRAPTLLVFLCVCVGEKGGGGV
jgi:hypothetical protein